MAITEAAVHAFHLLHLAQPGPSLAPLPVPPKRRKSSSGPGEPSKTAKTNRASRPRTTAPTSLFPLVFRPTPTTIHLSATAAPVSRPGRPEGRRESRDSLPSPSPALELDAEYGRASSSGSTSSASAALPSSAPADADADADEEVYELDETRIESSPPLRSSPLVEKKKRKRERAAQAKQPSAVAADQADKAKESKPKRQKQKKQSPILLPAPTPPLPGATTIDPRFLLMPSPSSPSSAVAGLPPALSGKKKKRHSRAGPSWVTQTPQASSQ